MPVPDINSLTASLTNLQLGEVPNQTTLNKNHKLSVMATSTNVLGKQDNQNAAALSTEEAIVHLLERTNYTLVQENGQRRYGPPPNWKCEAPPRGCEVFIGKIPRDCFEDELIPVFEQIGPIYMFRLMMEFDGANRGFGFCVYTNREDTKRAVQELNNYEIRKGKTIGVCLSVDNCRLFVGGIPKNKTREEILVEMKRVTEGVKDVISYPSVTDKTKNRGFAFVEYGSHKAAAMARRKLIPGRIQLWGQQIAVDWAEPEREVNEDIMSKVKILYVRNLMLSTTEEKLRECFTEAAGEDPNCIERVKKISDYAFIHFKEREQATRCLHTLNDTYIDGSKIEVTWAKPVDKTDISTRQPTSRTTGKMMNELVLSNDLNAAACAAAVAANGNPILFDARNNTACAAAAVAAVNGLVNTFDSNSTFLLSATGGHSNSITQELLALNQDSLTPGGLDINLGNNSAIKLNNGIRTGRRNAAGSRSAGAQRDRKHPVEKLQQRQVNPLVYFELLEEFCRNAGWGSPIYSALPADFVDPNTGNKLQLYIGQVCLPNLRLHYQGPRYYVTPGEAKLGALEAALQNLQYTFVSATDALANYAVAVNSGMVPVPAFMPMQLSNNGTETNNNLGIIPTQTGTMQLNASLNMTTPNMGSTTNVICSTAQPSDCSAALLTNSFEYPSQLLTASPGLINPFGNHYYFDPNTLSVAAANAMMLNSGTLGPIPQLIGVPQTNTQCNDLIQHPGQLISLNSQQSNLSGLHALGLRVSAIATSGSETTPNANPQTTSIVNILGQSNPHETMQISSATNGENPSQSVAGHSVNLSLVNTLQV